jgi:hypothetical protein
MSIKTIATAAAISICCFAGYEVFVQAFPCVTSVNSEMRQMCIRQTQILYGQADLQRLLGMPAPYLRDNREAIVQDFDALLREQGLTPGDFGGLEPPLLGDMIDRKVIEELGESI